MDRTGSSKEVRLLLDQPWRRVPGKFERVFAVGAYNMMSPKQTGTVPDSSFQSRSPLEIKRLRQIFPVQIASPHPKDTRSEAKRLHP